MERFIIVAPVYNSFDRASYALHRLGGALHALGYWTRIAILDPKGVRKGRAEEFARERTAPPLGPNDAGTIKDAIVIYPDFAPGNLLESTKVVWYLQERDGVTAESKINAGTDDYFIAHSARISDPRVRDVLYHCDPHPAFFAESPGYSRSIDLTYVGQGDRFGPCSRVHDSLEIGADWPSTAPERARLLQSTRYLYTWDPWSPLTLEALLCGVVPVAMRWDPWRADDIRHDEIGPLLIHGFGEHVFNTWEDCVFRKNRAELVSRIATMQESWNARVHAFAENAISHFTR